MTCIVGLVDKGKVYIGGDSAGSDGSWNIVARVDAKVWSAGPFVFGFTTSFRMGQLLRYSLSVSEQTSTQDVEQFMCTTFIDAVRSCLKTGGWASSTNGQEAAGSFLVGYRGRLFAVHGDYQVAESLSGYDAVGGGSPVALGALFATAGTGSPSKRVMTALEAAEHGNAAVRGPFHVEVLDS